MGEEEKIGRGAKKRTGNRRFRYFASSPPGRFATTLDSSLPGRFATWTFRTIGRFDTCRMFVTSLDVSPPVSKLVISHTVTTSANLNILWTDDKELPT